MSVQLTIEQQATRTAGMQVFGVKLLSQKVEQALLSTHRNLRSSLSGWRSRLQEIGADQLELLAFCRDLKSHANGIANGPYARVKVLDASVRPAVENSAGYPIGFVEVSCLVVDGVLSLMLALNAESTIEDLQAIFNAIETELQEEPQL